ncbi:hypothetical protein PMAYCL1PPCAC_05492, partial [Pristionchus mayeri]
PDQYVFPPSGMLVIVFLICGISAELHSYYNAANIHAHPVHSRVYGGTFATTEKAYNMAEEVDGIVKYYTNLIFPTTAQRHSTTGHNNCAGAHG